MAYSAKMLTFRLLDNLFFVLLVAFFAYRTFFEGRLNWALLVLLVALSLMTICRIVAQYSQKVRVGFIYRTLVLLSAGLLAMALGIQTLRFVFVFAPGLVEPTMPKILVRIGVTTAIGYVFALLFAFVYYLRAHGMLWEIWNGFADRLARPSLASEVVRHQDWRHIRFSNMVLIRTFFWGGVASILTLAVGLVAWLLR
jgi:hypothetical protein